MFLGSWQKILGISKHFFSLYPQAYKFHQTPKTQF